MLLRPPPKSNVERQREFRERNPGYFQKYHARKRAKVKAWQAAALAAEQVAEPVVEVAAEPVVRREVLMLPAPVEAIVVPGMNAVGESLAAKLELLELACRRAEAA